MLRILGKYKSIIWIGLLIYILASSILGFGIYMLIKSSTGSSVEALKLTTIFDRTVISDMLASNKNWSSIFNSHLLLSLIAFIFLNHYMNSGFISTLAKNENTLKQLFKNGWQNFFKIFPFTLIQLSINIIVISLIVFCLVTFIGNGFSDFKTEEPIFYSIITGLFLMAIIILFNWLIFTKAKAFKVTNHSFNASLKSSIESIFRNKKFVFLFIVLSLILWFLSFIWQGSVAKWTNASTYSKILLTFLCLQIGHLFRFIFKFLAMVYLIKES
jgi:hypothetical protein